MSVPAQSTRNSLINAAIRVFSASPSATLSDVATEAGVKRVTLHRLFGTKDALMKEVAAQSLREIDKVFAEESQDKGSAIAVIKAIVEAIVPMGDRWHFIWRQYDIWHEPELLKELGRQYEIMAAIVDRAKSEGSIEADIPTRWITASIDAVVFAAFSASQEGDIAVNDASQLALRTLLRGIETK